MRLIALPAGRRLEGLATAGCNPRASALLPQAGAGGAEIYHYRRVLAFPLHPASVQTRSLPSDSSWASSVS